MRKLFTFSVLLINNILFGQSNLGYIDYVYMHKLDTISDSKISKTNFRIIFDNENSYSFNLNKLKSMQNISDKLRKQDSEFSAKKIVPAEFTVHNYKYKTVETYQNINVWYKTLDTINIDWSLTQESKTFLNYNCQKAIGKFKGRIYEAWFTTDISLPIAPWKLKGLPGAILYAVDKTGSVEFTAINININSTEDIVEIPQNVETISKEKLKIIEENYISQINGNFTVKKNGEDFKLSSQKRKAPTNPIELTK